LLGWYFGAIYKEEIDLRSIQSTSAILTASMLQHFATLAKILPHTSFLGVKGVASVLVTRPAKATRETREVLIFAVW